MKICSRCNEKEANCKYGNEYVCMHCLVTKIGGGTMTDDGETLTISGATFDENVTIGDPPDEKET